MQKAIFGGGCFWCTEAVFQSLKGVLSVIPGYAGGATIHPTYLQVASGATGHAEVIRIEYDPSIISYQDLLEIFFACHDPTSLNKQGNDQGTQYRSVIFVSSEEERKEAENFIKNLGEGIVTEVLLLDKFYEAEKYHHSYYATNKTAPYCQIIINPKLEKIQQKFTKFLKPKE